MRVFNLAEELEKERKKNKELEKEINRLTAESTHYESKYYNEAKKVDDAIEYIEDNVNYNELTDYGYIDKKEVVDKLINILKGE